MKLTRKTTLVLILGALAIALSGCLTIVPNEDGTTTTTIVLPTAPAK
jgi:starvation-inducible outer membrane lipoprotein